MSIVREKRFAGLCTKGYVTMCVRESENSVLYYCTVYSSMRVNCSVRMDTINRSYTSFINIALIVDCRSVGSWKLQLKLKLKLRCTGLHCHLTSELRDIGREVDRGLLSRRRAEAAVAVAERALDEQWESRRPSLRLLRRRLSASGCRLLRVSCSRS